MKNVLIDFTQSILKANYIPVHRITFPCTFSDISWLDLGLRNNFFDEKTTNSYLNRWFMSFQPKKIYHLTDDFLCNYTIFRIPDSDEFFICGPFLFEEMQSSRFMQICDKLKIPAELHDQLKEYYLSMAFFPVQTLYMNLFTELAEFLFGKDNYEIIYSDSRELDEWYTTYHSSFRIPENPFAALQTIENRYELEAAIIEAVKNADEQKALELTTKTFSLFLPHRMSNELRDQKDYTITFNTLLGRAAKSCGVHPIHIDTYSNRNIQIIEQLTSIEQCHNFSLKIVHNYCCLIRKHTLKNYSLLTQKIITYVNTDLSADLSLKSLSEQLSVNASYLSTLFSKEVGMSLTKFVNQKRIEHSKKLLLATDMPIKSIALKCGISDVYYFSRLFKQITGTTPKEYRKTATRIEPQKLSTVNFY